MSPKKMERKTRLELATPTLARWCSTTELFPHLEATFRIELKNRGFAVPGLTTWLCRQKKWSGKRDSNSRPPPWQGGALPLSYFRKMATRMGLEPMTSAVTGRHSNQLNYRAVCRFCISDVVYYRGHTSGCQAFIFLQARAVLSQLDNITPLVLFLVDCRRNFRHSGAQRRMHPYDKRSD